jgi:hydrogenase maturation protein HypF
VLLPKKADLSDLAPNLREIGIMLPYTPLHVLLLDRLGAIVATSSNPKDAPIIKDETEGFAGLCDYVLTHNRPIEMRADDSVLKIVRGEPVFVRRARGYVPYPQRVPKALAGGPPVLALGAELKNTVSIFKDDYVVTSQFLGDLDDYRNRLYFEETVDHLTRLFTVKPACVVTDLHPGFHTTRIAEKMGLPHLRVPHHYAHLLAVLLDRGVEPGLDVLGIIWDGYGYGNDGEAWGGEFLVGGYNQVDRFAHFEPRPLPGGDLAAKEPWRMALSYLRSPEMNRPPDLPALRGINQARREAVWEMIGRGVRSPRSSSCGRLFDAVAALIGLAPIENEYEAEAAMRLEAAAAKGRHRAYPIGLIAGDPMMISFAPMIKALLADLGQGTSPGIISARFHETLAATAVEVARIVRKKRGIGTVILGGGVFLNRRLLDRTETRLIRAGFRVLKPRQYSPNDESISVGQIAFALAHRKKIGISSINLSD